MRDASWPGDDTGEADTTVSPEAVVPWERASWFDRWPPVFARGGALDRVLHTASETMKIEEYTIDDEYVIRADVPGVDPEIDIDVAVAGQQLIISATRERTEESLLADGFRSELHYGALHRSIALPPGAVADEVTADYLDGVLEVRVPIERTEATTVPVQRES